MIFLLYPKHLLGRLTVIKQEGLDRWIVKGRVVQDTDPAAGYLANNFAGYRKKIKKFLVFNKTYQHFWSLFHSYFILNEKVLKKVCSFKVRTICSTVKPDIRPDTGYQKRPDIWYNPIIYY